MLSSADFVAAVFRTASRACNEPAATRPSFDPANRAVRLRRVLQKLNRLVEKTGAGVVVGDVQPRLQIAAQRSRHSNAAPTSRADPVAAFLAATQSASAVWPSLRKTSTFRLRARRLSVSKRSERLRCSSAVAQFFRAAINFRQRMITRSRPRPDSRSLCKTHRTLRRRGPDNAGTRPRL